MISEITNTKDKARAAIRPLLLADWRDALFIHFRVDPRLLQPLVPLPLDLHDGHAWISLVAFTQHRLRPALKIPGGELLSRPLARHEFLNLRTYVRHTHEQGIYFLNEWIPNRLAVFLGPKLYGLPYKLAAMAYHTAPGYAMRHVNAAGHFACTARWSSLATPMRTPPGSEAEFLLERYTAYTLHRGVLRRFRISHAPWLQTPVEINVVRRDLLANIPIANAGSAQYSPGLRNVAIAGPQRL